MTDLEKGDAQGAEQVLTRAAAGPGSDRDVFFSLGELKRSKNQVEEAVGW